MAINLSYSTQTSCLNQGLDDELRSDLVKVNKRLRITGLDEHFSSHVGITLPPKKKQRVENSVATASVKPSVLFRPWESPSSHANLGFSPMPGAISFANTYSNSLSTGASIFSEIPQVYSNYMPFESYLQTVHMINTTAPNLSTAVTFPILLGESDIEGDKISDGKLKPKSWGRGFNQSAPGKERCDICGRSYFKLALHKKTSHGLLKKPIDCCGITFTTVHSFRTHRKSGCNFKSSHNRLSTGC